MELGAYEEMARLEDHHWWFRGKRRLLRPLLSAALASGEHQLVMDVGCGTGGNLSFVESGFPGVRTLGLDFEPDALRYCGERDLAARLLRGDGTRLPIADGALDCLTALDIVEHFDDDEALLAEFARVLKPGGQAVISVPAYPSLWSPHDDFLHHKRRYRTGELERKLEQAGFHVARRQGFNFLLLPPIALVRWIKARRSKAGAEEEAGTDFFELPRPLNALLAGLFVVEEWLVKLFGIPFGVSLMVRAERR